jgi:hypothetical protein
MGDIESEVKKDKSKLDDEIKKIKWDLNEDV